MEVHQVADTLDAVEGNPEQLQTKISELLRGKIPEEFRTAVMDWRDEHSELFAAESTHVLPPHND